VSALAPCARCESPLERGDLRCAICGQSAPPATAGAAREPAAPRAEVLRCQGCGAAVAYSVEAQAPQCRFCDSVMRVEQVEDPLEQSQGYLPFRVEPAAAQDALRSWFGRQGFFRAQDLGERARLEHLRPLWWVAWLFDVEARVSWTADSEVGAGRSAWAPHAGQTDIDLRAVLVSASRGLNDEEAARLAPTYDLGSVEASPRGASSEGGPEGAFVEAFDVQRSLARRRIVASIERLAADHVRNRCVPGRRCRNLHVAALMRGLHTRRYGFPAYVLAYRYKDRLYRAVVSGQDARVVVATAPLSLARVALAVLGGVVLVLLLLALAAAIVSAS